MTLPPNPLAEDDLRRMALGRTGTLPAPPRPFPEITARAARIRRTRTAAIGAATAGTLAVAALAVAVAVNGLPGGSNPRVSPGAGISAQPGPAATGSPAGADCSTGYAAAATFEQVPGLLHLPPAEVAGDPLVLSFARDDRSACTPPATAALWYATTGDTVSARIQVDGPGATDGYDHPGGGFGGKVTTETLGDRTVRVYDMLDTYDRPWTMYFWTEPDGSTWWADVQGLDGAAARAAVAGLRVDGGRVDPASRPDALPEGGTGDGAPVSRHRRYFYAAFKDQNEDAGGWSVEIGDRAGLGWQALVGSRKVDVDGRPGWVTPGKPGANVTWQGADGNLYHVHGTISEAKALRVARALVPVGPDDPRLVASKETPVPDDSETNTSRATATP